MGATLMVVGVVTAIVIVAVGVITFVRDVNRLVRTSSGGDLIADLEAGEYYLYDEDDGIDLGPLDVRITRLSDGVGVGTTDVDDGPSYDIGGNAGEAALSFDLPSAGDYRIETTTGVGEIASFAVGPDVGAGPLSSLTRGLVIGGLLFVLGLVLVIWGAVQRGRARLRSRAEQALEQSKRAVESTAGAIDDPDRRRQVATRHGRRISQTAAERADAAPAPLRGELDRAAAAAESAVGDLAASTEAPSELLGRLGDSLGRAQERLAAGDSLRDVARDGATELRGIGTDAGREAVDVYGSVAGAADAAVAEGEARRGDLLAERDQLVAAAGAQADRRLVAAERIAEGTGDEISAALDSAASDLIEAALQSAGEVNDEAKAAIDAASAELRAASRGSVPHPAPASSGVGALSPPEPPPPPPGQGAPTAATGARGLERSGDLDRPLVLAPPPTARIPVGSTPTVATAGEGPDPGPTAPMPTFAALAPPPSALGGPLPASRGSSTVSADRRALRTAPALAPAPTGRRPDPPSSPGADATPG